MRILRPIFSTCDFNRAKSMSLKSPSPQVVAFGRIYFYLLNDVNKKVLLNLLFGSLFSFLLVASLFLINKIPIENFLTQYIFYPLSLGESRIDRLNIDFKNLQPRGRTTRLIFRLPARAPPGRRWAGSTASRLKIFQINILGWVFIPIITF